MNEDDLIERELQQLRPAPLSPSLMARLTAARPSAPVQKSPLLLWRYLLAGAAACTFLTFALWQRVTPGPPPSSTLEADAVPLELRSYLIATREVGTLIAPDSQPYRIMELEWLDQSTIHLPGEASALRIEHTRRDVVPIAMTLH